MSANDSLEFKSMIDEIVLFASNDPELQTSIAWLDTTNVYGMNLTFYEKCFEVLWQYDIKKKAKEWVSKKN